MGNEFNHAVLWWGDDWTTLAMGTEGPRGQEVEALERQAKLKEIAPGPRNCPKGNLYRSKQRAGPTP